MKLKIDHPTGKDGVTRFYAREGVRDGGHVNSVTRIRFGTLEDLLKITDDPLAYCRQKADEYEREHSDEFEERITFNDNRLPTDKSLNVGYFFLQHTMKDLKLSEFIDIISQGRRFKFPGFDILRFLIYSRVLDPASKLQTVESFPTYFEQPDIKYEQVLRFMDLLEEHHDEYLEWLYKKSSKCVKRNTSVIYYDCTNFFCEIEHADEEDIDPITGVVMTGLRQYGISKEHRPTPIVEMGLYTDRDGIPITMCVEPGNKQETTTAVPLEKVVVKLLGNEKRFVYCADAGLGTYDIRKFNSLSGRAFIVTQSIKKLSDDLQKAVFNDTGYRLMSNNKSVKLSDMKSFDAYDENYLSLYEDRAYKVFCADKTLDLGLYEIEEKEDGTTKKTKVKELLPQRIIVTFSRELFEYQRYIRNGQIERAKKRIATCDPETIKKGSNDVNRFIKTVRKDENGNKIETKCVLDTDKIAEEEKYDGFYAVATNLEDDPAEQSAWDIMNGNETIKKAPSVKFVRRIFEVIRDRYQIEDCFRALKKNFQTRPMYHRLTKRVRAHFLLCYSALLVQRLIQKKMLDKDTPITVEELIKTMQRMKVAKIDAVYHSLYDGGETLRDLMKLTGLELDKKKYMPTTINKMIGRLTK